MAVANSLCSLNLLHSLDRQSSQYLWLKPVTQLSSRYLCLLSRQAGISCRRLVVVAATEGSTKSSKSDETIPSWARPDSDDPPPWAKDEGNKGAQPTIQIPFYAYLLASAVTAIAAIGSVFEYVNQKPVFGVLNSDSVFYAPILGFFAFTGIPTSAFLWYKSVQVANKEAEEQDRKDGFL